MKRVCVKAPINIALVKYWGKHDEVNVLPFNPSISLSLDLYETKTILQAKEAPGLEFTLNEQSDPKSEGKVRQFLSFFPFDETQQGLVIRSYNTGPTAAGLASSASAFAALAVACNQFFGEPYDFDTLASITKKGSGSAIRSLLGGCVEWDTQGRIHALDWPFDDVVLGVVVLVAGRKDIGSTEGMKHTIQTAPSYLTWVEKAHQDALAFKAALADQDFTKIGHISEANALAMHAVCEDANPPIQYLNKQSRALIQGIQSARKQGLFEAYCTMDAGPNIKLLHRAKDSIRLNEWLKTQGFPLAQISRIAEKGAHRCED